MPSQANTSDNDAFWLPEESDPHLRTFMQWPVRRVVHTDPMFLDMLQQSIADVANSIVEFEPVVMLMDKQHERAARQKLSDAIEIWDIPTDDLWCRDSGPVFVKNSDNDTAIANLNFNGWGNKQFHKNDGQIARRISEHLSLPLIDSGLVGELGGVESDGDGTLLAHESSWVNKNRNSESRFDIEQKLLTALGGRKMIWADGIKDADITDYHIDSLARFVSAGKVIIQMPFEITERDPWSLAAKLTFDTLVAETDADGQPFEIVVIDEPYDTRVTSTDFVASYVNYYVCNGAVISAEFGDREADAAARSTLSHLYPEREIITLNVDPIGEVGGGIHCATQQQPF